ncbi:MULTISPECIES: ABC transporter ATP-binding protein [Halorussus]|uniref:ABC transporter ATP-binding protein n=1 Tax=Halorussus TaxID=1070314 RepID=UPI0020A1D703|nr:ABC transporter ATP-binding protein [Halorussus vallis]USZ76315.1 ABC transporter ATP-binding protein [Halorussus vallis]
MQNLGNRRRQTEANTASPNDATLPDGVVLRAAGVEKRYGSRLPFRRSVEVLTGANLTLVAGEIVGVVGENGSGKSTLMKILVGALDADSGSVTRRGTVGWCPQDPLLYDRLTVDETFRLFGSAYGLPPDEIERAASRLADRLDFESYRDYRVENLSGGNRQKVNLGVSLLHDPDVLFLDEPYTGFDWETYLSFWDLTEELVERGTGICVISHLINERERFDRICELRDGKLYEQRADQVGDDGGDVAVADPADGEGVDGSA